MDEYWTIKAIGNGYVVTYPYVSNLKALLSEPTLIKYASLFKSSFDEALKILKENSMEPTVPE